MNTQEEKIAKEAITRQLEHHIDELCEVLIKDITFIKDSAHVTIDNFELMVSVGESLEQICSASGSVLLFLKQIKTAEKMLPSLTPISFKTE